VNTRRWSRRLACVSGSAALVLPTRSAAVGWGNNFVGQLGHGTTTASATYAGVSGLSNGVAQIAAGASSGMAVRVQIRRGSVVRTVWTWGHNTYGQLGDGTTTNSATPAEVSGLNVPSVSAISAGGAFSMVLGSDGSIWAWGLNSDGELGNGTTTKELRPVEILVGAITGISAGYSDAMALLRGGSVLAWGTACSVPAPAAWSPWWSLVCPGSRRCPQGPTTAWPCTRSCRSSCPAASRARSGDDPAAHAART
jgi:alpha-tubulin suppressor-like RCC1 family protein